MKHRLKLKDLEVSSFVTSLSQKDQNNEIGATGGCTTTGTTITMSIVSIISLISKMSYDFCPQDTDNCGPSEMYTV